MAKTKSATKLQISYANADSPVLEYADFVRLVSGPNGVVFGFGQHHPHKQEILMRREIVVPYAVAVRLHDILGSQLNEVKKMVEEQSEE